MPFTWQPTPRASGNIADILMRSGENQARLLLGQGQAKADLARTIGGAVSQTAGSIGDILQQRKEAPLRALAAQKLQQDVAAGGFDLQQKVLTAERAQQARQVLTQAIQEATVDDPEMGTRKVDHNRVVAGLQRRGFPELVDEYVKQATGLDALNTPKVTSVNPEHDAYTDGVLTRKGTPPAQTPAQAETVRHNQAMEAIGGLTAGRAQATQAETARHNRTMEDIGRLRVTNATTNKPSTGIEKSTLSFFNRARQADEELSTVEADVTQMGLLSQTRMAYAPNVAQSETGQRYQQAQRAFTEARLRKDSGAAIPEQEFANDRKTYFAQPGDGPVIAAQKARARAAVLASLAFGAGKALGEFYGDEAPAMLNAFKTRAAQPQQAPPAPAGWKYVPKPGGGWTAVEDK